jgi:geranylgeranyl diphosphate synthase type II
MKWDVNSGILCLMMLLILAYQYFEQYEPILFYTFGQVVQTALEVCEGQQWDVDFGGMAIYRIPQND